MKVYTEKTSVLAVAHILKYFHPYVTYDTLKECCGVDSNKTLQKLDDMWDVGSEQADAIIDIIYYMCNALVKLGYKKIDVCDENINAMFACVKEFTEQSMNQTFPIQRFFNEEEMLFIVKMVLSECEELFDTVALTKDHSRRLLLDALELSKDLCGEENILGLFTKPDNFLTTCYDCIEEMGLNSVELFTVVHNANMNKRDPLTNKFIRRGDGKILKPTGWQPPNMRQEVITQERKRLGMRKSY